MQVLYRFLEFFSKFDWDSYCVSLLGLVPISSLPDVTGTSVLIITFIYGYNNNIHNQNKGLGDASFSFYNTVDPPRKDGGMLLLTKAFLDECGSKYAVVPPYGRENPERRFVPKYFNVIDPLRADNNLGRSVNKGI